MSNIPQDGIYVVFIYAAGGESRGETIKFRGNRYYLTVSEILEFFGVKKLEADEKIWIKRKDTSNIRSKHYELSAQLTWEDFSKCTIIIAPSHGDAVAALNPPKTEPVASSEAQHQKSLDEQLKLWQEKKKEKEKKGPHAPKSAILRKKVIRAIIKKKRKTRIELEQKDAEHVKIAQEDITEA